MSDTPTTSTPTSTVPPSDSTEVEFSDAEFGFDAAKILEDVSVLQDAVEKQHIAICANSDILENLGGDIWSVYQGRTQLE